MSHRVVAVVTDTLEGREPVEEIWRSLDGERVAVRLVVPTVETNRVRQATSDSTSPGAWRESRRPQASVRGGLFEPAGPGRAHVIGLTQMEAVSYRRGAARFFRMAA